MAERRAVRRRPATRRVAHATGLCAGIAAAPATADIEFKRAPGTAPEASTAQDPTIAAAWLGVGDAEALLILAAFVLVLLRLTYLRHLPRRRGIAWLFDRRWHRDRH